MPKYEEQIGVKIPGQGYYMVSLAVGPFDSDEQVLSRISTKVGTVYNVTGSKFEVISSSPFRLKRLVQKAEVDEEEKVVAPKAKVQQPASEPPPASERRPSQPAVAPQVGEQWKPKDPRRIASFLVVVVEADHVVTDDGRKIQLARFHRYERVTTAASKAS